MIAAAAYMREAALKPESQKAGYGIYTHSQRLLIARVIEGNEFVIRRSKPLSKEDDLQIEVTGEVKGNVLKVESIRIMQEQRALGEPLTHVRGSERTDAAEV